jgi:hypothetical protein
MIFMALTHPKRKLNLLLKLVLLTALLLIIFPVVHGMMTEANSLQNMAAEPEEKYPGEPVRVEADAWPIESQYWQDIAIMLQAE